MAHNTDHIAKEKIKDKLAEEDESWGEEVD
jgi:hypothetical protein